MSIGFRKGNRTKEKKLPLEKYVEEWPDHDVSEPCPQCGEQLKEDPIGGFFLMCPRCRWKGW